MLSIGKERTVKTIWSKFTPSGEFTTFEKKKKRGKRGCCL